MPFLTRPCTLPDIAINPLLPLETNFPPKLQPQRYLKSKLIVGTSPDGKVSGTT